MSDSATMAQRPDHDPGVGGEPPLLEIDRLHVGYRVGNADLEALHDINLRMRRGEILGVVGESGSGKSTLSSAIMRLLPPNGRITSGDIRLEGTDVVELGATELRSLRGTGIGMVFQDPLTSLNPTFSIATQMIDAQRAHGLGDSDQDRRERAVEMLGRVGIPDADTNIDTYPHSFSGGMRQRIMIATVLLLQPRLLICDEVTSALDVTLQAQILKLLCELCEERDTSILLISHDLGVVSQVCHELAVLYAGRVVERGRTAEVVRSPEHPYTRRLLASVPSRNRRHEALLGIPGRPPDLGALPPGCKYADRCEFVQPVCDDGEPELYSTDVGRARCLIHAPESSYDQQRAAEIEQERARERERPPTPPDPDRSRTLLAVEDLRVHFPQGRGLVAKLTGREPPPPVRAVDGVGFEIAPGEALGLVGESGSGKTTLGKALLGLVPITDGTANFDGHSLEGLSSKQRRPLRQRMQMIFQDPYGSLSPRQRVTRLISEPYRINKIPVEERQDVADLLDMVQLSAEQATKYPHQLSGGQARRVGIARALAVQPDFIVADEPTAGLDVSAAASVLNLLQDLRSELGLSLLTITHDLNLVGYITDRIAVMYLGKIVELGTADQIFDTPRHPYTQALLAAIPEPDPEATGPEQRIATVEGEVPSALRPPSGCRFRTRCPFAEDRCVEEVPPRYPVADEHSAACHFWKEIAEGDKARTGPRTDHPEVR